ncbi:MAG: AtzG-like protein [Hyphomicrobiaceae bacterium]
MPKRIPNWQTYVDTMGPVVGLEIRDEWKANVASFLALAASNAALYADLPFDDATDESAAVFRPGDAP